MNLLVKDKRFYKKMAVIAIPISLQSMITIGVNMTDTVMVGKLGETSLSAAALHRTCGSVYAANHIDPSAAYEDVYQ